MLFRCVVETDLDEVLSWTVREPVSWITAEAYRAELAEHRYRPEWTWIAVDGDRIVARAVWWGFADSAHPLALDCLSVHDSVADKGALGAGLLDAARGALFTDTVDELPDYHLRLPGGWRSVPATASAVAWRREAAARAGLTDEVERSRYVWTPDVGTPPQPTRRLTLRPEPDDEVFLSVFRRVAVGSLDVATHREVAAVGVDRQAREDMDFYLGMPGRRDWWRLAFTPDGRLAGLAIPSATPHGPNVGYLGVVPELRGHGYVDDLLAEITRIHAIAGAQRITATTDTTNVPMAAAFDRAGYRNTEVRLVLSGPPE